MSDFVQQNSVLLDFNSSDSWVILSPIEMSIKKKIESVGVPLKDWGISIYRGVLTGFNEAFIISTEKRDEILANCQSEEEYRRTDDLIRPILRGRDIKRYGYDWAGLWLINTHNGIKGSLDRIHIEDYPSVKAHLDQYWDKISIRTDKGDTPYNLRNCAYLDDFNKPKAMWKIIGSNICFSFDSNAMLCNNAVNIITGDADRLLQFVGMMNSKLFEWYLKITNEAPIADERVQLYVTTLEKTLLKLDFPNFLSDAILNRINGCASDNDVNVAVYKAYKLSDDEIGYIDSI